MRSQLNSYGYVLRLLYYEVLLSLGFLRISTRILSGEVIAENIGSPSKSTVVNDDIIYRVRGSIMTKML